jgi:3-dehydroquinate dehydratase-2
MPASREPTRSSSPNSFPRNGQSGKPSPPKGKRRQALRAAYRILFLNGPNLNVLGKREPDVYGKKTLDEIRHDVTEAARGEGASVSFFQSNHEGEIVTRLQEARENADGLVLNLGGYTHSSVAIRDALLFAGLPAVEVHLSNLARREPFRRQSMIEDVVIGRIAGFGGFGYVLALRAILEHLRKEGGIDAS